MRSRPYAIGNSSLAAADDRRRNGRTRAYDKADGIDFVRCLICGKHLRVINGCHLSTHGTDRETYIEEYRLSPDQLCAKDFRTLHSSRRDYYPHGQRDWIATIKNVQKQHGQVFAGYLQDHEYPFSNAQTKADASIHGSIP